MKILFVCRHNRFRSKVAEVIFNKLNKNKEIKAESAGIVEGEPPVAQIVTELMEKRGVEIKNITPRKFNDEFLEENDLIVIVADDVDRSLFNKYGKKIVVWKISDADAGSAEEVEDRIDKIEEKVLNLIKRFHK